MNRCVFFCSALATTLMVSASIASAQQMGQGEANITATAEVELSLRSGAATDSNKLGELADVISGQLGDLKACYFERVARNPELQGTMRLHLSISERRTNVEVTENTSDDEGLARCMTRILRRADFDHIRPPANVIAVLTMTNDAAAGVTSTRARAAEEGDVEVTRDEDGNLRAQGGAENGQVTFEVIGDRGQSETQVAAVQRGMRRAIPILLDCRRRSARTSSPEGEIVLNVRVTRERHQVRVRNSTVQSPRGGRCLTRHLQRAVFEEGARGAIKVIVRFSGEGAIPVHDE